MIFTHEILRIPRYESHEILCNLESDLDLAQSEIMNYIEKQPEKKTEENLVSLLSKTPIFDPENIWVQNKIWPQNIWTKKHLGAKNFG